MIENYNSRLRNYFFLLKEVGSGYLDLLRFFLNHRRFMRSEHPQRVRTGNSPQVLAAIRNAAVHLLEEVDAPSKAAATRHFHVHPHEALPLLFT